jgi:hypothetical protein
VGLREQQIAGFDYDVGAERVRVAATIDEAQLFDVLSEWGLQPQDFKYPYDTADPR